MRIFKTSEYGPDAALHFTSAGVNSGKLSPAYIPTRPMPSVKSPELLPVQEYADPTSAEEAWRFQASGPSEF